jgi:ornithine carbamoyltransferase
MMKSPALKFAQGAVNGLQKRAYSQSSGPRHLMTIADLTPTEFANLVRNAASRKAAVKGGSVPAGLNSGLSGQTVAMMFSKRSTRTRVSTEAAVNMLGGHPMFLGKDDIQLGVSSLKVFHVIGRTNHPIRSTSRFMIPPRSYLL